MSVESTGRCTCFIVPKRVLERFARDKKLTSKERAGFANAAKLESEWRQLRVAKAAFAVRAQALLPSGVTAKLAAAPPLISVSDCKHGTALPGVPVPKPQGSTDSTARRAFAETKDVASFYRQCFGRNSVDDAGAGLLSSIHYSVKYNNAFWNGSQMTYGDGDGNIFVDFTGSNDVIAHELTHGVTQFTANLDYTDEPGGLNESISDVFGSMFRQWQANESVVAADWLIGKDIMGPGATARGYTCLRDLSNPAANHCLAPQPKHFKNYKNGMDPHESSGIPNFAFYNAATAIGGKSWEKAGRIWYAALTGFPPAPKLKMKPFADRTRKLAKSMYSKKPEIWSAVDAAWKTVGL